MISSIAYMLFVFVLVIFLIFSFRTFVFIKWLLDGIYNGLRNIVCYLFSVIKQTLCIIPTVIFSIIQFIISGIHTKIMERYWKKHPDEWEKKKREIEIEKEIEEERKKQEAIRQEEAKARKKYPWFSKCDFSGGISQSEFENIVIDSAKSIRGVSITEIDGPLVYCRVKSISKKSEWCFKLSFNDFGHITGNYWSLSDNDDSQKPRLLGSSIKAKIQNRPHY